jgi:hypothetical protein
MVLNNKIKIETLKYKKINAEIVTIITGKSQFHKLHNVK